MLLSKILWHWSEDLLTFDNLFQLIFSLIRHLNFPSSNFGKITATSFLHIPTCDRIHWKVSLVPCFLILLMNESALVSLKEIEDHCLKVNKHHNIRLYFCSALAVQWERLSCQPYNLSRYTPNECSLVLCIKFWIQAPQPPVLKNLSDKSSVYTWICFAL